LGKKRLVLKGEFSSGLGQKKEGKKGKKDWEKGAAKKEQPFSWFFWAAAKKLGKKLLCSTQIAALPSQKAGVTNKNSILG
jgi:hypothetical protein